MSWMPAALRNPPVQARSRDRLQRVLDAAERVLSDEGAEALTTTRVAEAAGVPVGSVYRFFADKDAIVEALALRYWAEFGEIVAALTEGLESEPAKDPAAVIIDALADAFRATPGFRALWFGGLRSERLRDVTRPGRAEFTGHLERMLAASRPSSDPALRESTARTLVLVGDGLLREAFRLEPSGDRALLVETKIALNAYLGARLGPPEPSRRTFK
jgi:AcrR family transcriptional regulator